MAQAVQGSDRDTEGTSDGSYKGKNSAKSREENLDGLGEVLSGFIGDNRVKEVLDGEKAVVVTPDRGCAGNLLEHDDVVAPPPEEVPTGSGIYDSNDSGIEMIENALEGAEHYGDQDDAVLIFLGLRWPGIENDLPSNMEVGEQEGYDPVFWDRTEELAEIYSGVLADYPSRMGALALPSCEDVERENLGGGFFYFSK